ARREPDCFCFEPRRFSRPVSNAIEWHGQRGSTFQVHGVEISNILVRGRAIHCLSGRRREVRYGYLGIATVWRAQAVPFVADRVQRGAPAILPRRALARVYLRRIRAA